MSDVRLVGPDDDDDDEKARRLLEWIREQQPLREVLVADERPCVEVDPTDPATMHEATWREEPVAHAVVRHRHWAGTPAEVVESWAPLEQVPVARLTDGDFDDVVGWMEHNLGVRARRIREHVYVKPAPTTVEAERLEILVDEPVIHVGRFVFDGNDSLMLMQLVVMPRAGLLIYERNLEFEAFFPPMFLEEPPTEVLWP